MNARLARNDGFTTVAIMITMMMSSLLVVAAAATTTNGIPLARADQNQKQAYSAAEAGIAFYAYHLAQDPNYWTYCANPPSPASPNPVWDGTSSSPRNWRELPSPTSSTDQGAPPSYSITLVPPPGSTQCQAGLASSTFLNTQNGTFTIRSTGRYRGRKRSIVASFKRRGFVDFLWFTNFETPDPLTYPPADYNAANAHCAQYYRSGRKPWVPSTCGDQQFVGADQVLGPMHTNDRFRICNNPYFGQTANDRIESSDPNEFEQTCGAGPGGAGTFINNAPPLDFPPSNASLSDDTLIGWTFSGKTILHFNSNNTVDITNAGVNGGTKTTRALPANYVIYVKNSTCTVSYTEAQHYNNPVGCGDAWISGDYQKSLTVGADNDIIVNGSIKRTPSTPQAEMGLIANGFVRVYHPVNWNGDTECSQGDTTDATGTLINPEIDAAILTLRHSFVVDNYGCGAGTQGTLTVDGAIAQWFRGTVGLNSNGTITHGYRKGYSYDQNLRYADPPYFLDPVETSWNIVRETEQVPAQ
jgi:type II secretory pathway pseudopilin PulG